MTALQHVYLTAHGTYTAGAWEDERAQVGLRLCYVPVVGAPDKGSVFTPLVNGDVTRQYGSQAGTNGTLAKAWTARIGPVGSLQNCDAGAQIDLAEDFRTFLNAIKAYTFSGFTWTHVKIAPVAADGTSPENSAVYTFTTPLAGTSPNHLPAQVAFALSMRAQMVGRRGRGRIYLPAVTTALVAADGTVQGAAATTLRTAFKTLIDDLQNVTGTPDYIPIVSVMSAGSADAVRPYDVRTGHRLDTMQSRRRQAAESYTATNL